MWRLGVPAVLMVAFALVGLAQAPWRDASAPTPAPVVAPAHVFGTPALETGGASTPAAMTTKTEDVGAGDEPARQDVGATDEQPALASRLPEELEPVAPDVVVAMEPAHAEAGQPSAVAHTHVAEGAPDGGRAPTMLEGPVAPNGDDILGPEPGASFWFGPRGLERVRILGEAR